MTITQIASMNPIERAASIYSLPAFMLLPKACPYFTTCRARGPSRSNPFGKGIHRNGDGQERLLSKINGVKHRKSNDRRGNPDPQHVAHIMPGHALPRLLGRHDGALPALQVSLSEFGAVLRRTHGRSPTLCSCS